MTIKCCSIIKSFSRTLCEFSYSGIELKNASVHVMLTHCLQHDDIEEEEKLYFQILDFQKRLDISFIDKSVYLFNSISY